MHRGLRAAAAAAALASAFGNTVPVGFGLQATLLPSPALAASDPISGDYMGASLAASSDGLTLVASRCGLPLSNASLGRPVPTNRGAVAVYFRASRTAGWSLLETLTAPDGVAGDSLGCGWGPRSLALSLDGSVLVAGAPGAAQVSPPVNGTSTRWPGAGRVYVWERPAGSPSTPFGARLPRALIDGSPTTLNGGGLGQQVSVNGAGTVIVSTYGNGGNYFIVWRRTGPGANFFVEDRPALPPPPIATARSLAFSVISHDGFVIAASAPFWSSPTGASAGRVLMYTRSRDVGNVSGVWSFANVVNSPFPAVTGDGNPQFGNNIALSNNGAALLACAAWYRHSDGACAVFDRVPNGGGWFDSWSLSWQLIAGGDNYLTSASLGQDISMSDNGNVVMMGSEFASAAPEFRGAPGVVLRAARTALTAPWRVTDWIAPRDCIVGTCSFSSSAFLTPTGTEAAIGAPLWEDNVRLAGAVYQWPSATTYVNPRPPSVIPSSRVQYATTLLQAPDASLADQAGAAVASSADGNVVAVGAPGFGDRSGRVIVYSRSAATGGAFGAPFQVQPTLGAASNAWFGAALALSGSGSTLVVAAPCTDQDVACTGTVYTFTRDAATGSWAQVTAAACPASAPTAQCAPLTLASSGASGRGFGTDLALSADGTLLAVGAPFGAVTGKVNRGGAVLMYATPAAGFAGWTLVGSGVPPAPCSMDGANVNCYMGGKVAVSADGYTVAVGPGGFAYPVAHQGGTYVFIRNATTPVTDQFRLVAALGPRGPEHRAHGRGVALSDDGSVLASHFNFLSWPAVSVFRRAGGPGGAYALDSTLNETQALNNVASYGLAMAFSRGGGVPATLVVGDALATVGRATSSPGAVYVYSAASSSPARYGLNYVVAASGAPPGNASAPPTPDGAFAFGSSVRFLSDADGVFLVGSPGAAGAFIVFTAPPPPPGADNSAADGSTAGAVVGSIVGVALVGGLVALGLSWNAKRAFDAKKKNRSLGAGMGESFR